MKKNMDDMNRKLAKAFLRQRNQPSKRKAAQKSTGEFIKRQSIDELIDYLWITAACAFLDFEGKEDADNLSPEFSERLEAGTELYQDDIDAIKRELEKRTAR